MTRPVTDPQPNHEAADLWWLAKDGKAAGPYDRAELERGLRLGAVGTDDLACPDGQAAWRPIRQWADFAQAPPPSAALVPPPVPSAKPPWDPRAIAGWGILCSPIWAAGMAAANARRLGNGLAFWRPILVAAGGFVLTYLLELCLAPTRFWAPWLVDVSLYLATLWLLWRLDLSRQAAVYASRPHAGKAKWLWPGVIAAPLAAYVVLALVLAPFAPLEPRDVARRFMDANDVKTARRYSTPRLWPAVQAMFPDGGGPAEVSDYQLTADRDGEPGSHTHVVGFVVFTGDARGRHAIDGSLRLVDFDGPWKVDELFFEAYDSQPLPQPVAVSTDYAKLIAAAAAPEQQQPTATPQSISQSPAPPAEPAPAPAALPVVTASAAPTTDASSAAASTSQQGPQLDKLVAGATRSSLGALFSSNGTSGAAERQTAAAAAREAEETAGHDAGGIVAKGGKMAGAAALAVAAFFIKLVASLFGEPRSKAGNPRPQDGGNAAGPPGGR